MPGKAASPAGRNTPLDLSDKELRERLRKESQHVSWSPANYMDEIRRRAEERHATALVVATSVLALATIALLAATVAIALKP